MLLTNLNNEIDINDISSDEELYDSDRIDSDVEAELYSLIHHQQETSIENGEESLENYERESFITNNLELPENFKLSKNDFMCDKVPNCDLYNSFESPAKSKMQHSNNKTNLNKSLKRKSALESIQSNSKRKNITKTTLSETIILSSSDDDIIYTGANASQSFETNLSQDVSQNEAESNDSWCFRFPDSTSTPASNKSSWQINNDDLFRSHRKSDRYHNSRDLNCSNCNKKGHISKNCFIAQTRKCFICGNQHKPSYCKKKICSRCLKSSHDVRYCPKEILICRNCFMHGHIASECPDVWRKYQLTTAQKFVKPVRLPQNTPLYCYNCGQSGHFGGECLENRMRSVTLPTWPTVLNYNVLYKHPQFTETKSETPKSSTKKQKVLLKKLRRKNLKSPNQETTEKNLSFVDRFLLMKAATTSIRKDKKKIKKNKKNSVSPQVNSAQVDFQRTPKCKKSPNSNNISLVIPQLPRSDEKIKEKRQRKKERRRLKQRIIKTINLNSC